MTAALLKTRYDSGLSAKVTVGNVAANAYCLAASSDSGTDYKFVGPGGSVVSGAC